MAGAAILVSVRLASVVVGEADQFAHVDTEAITHQRELVSEGDVHIAEAVFGELHQFGGASGGGKQLALAEGGIEGLACFCGGGGETTDHAVVADQLLQDAARQHALRAVGTCSVVPTGEVDSSSTRLPGRSTGAIARAAAST